MLTASIAGIRLAVGFVAGHGKDPRLSVCKPLEKILLNFRPDRGGGTGVHDGAGQVLLMISAGNVQHCHIDVGDRRSTFQFLLEWQSIHLKQLPAPK